MTWTRNAARRMILSLPVLLVGQASALAQPPTRSLGPPATDRYTPPSPPTALAHEGEAMIPEDHLGRRVAPLLLLGRPDIRDELKLTSAQTISAHRAIDDLYRRALATQNLTGDEALAGRRAVDDAQRHWIDLELTGDQKARLDQIDLQWEGPQALITRPAVAASLALKAEQRAVLKEAVQRRNVLRNQFGPRPDDDRALAHEALAVLDAEQRIRWLAMLGMPFVPAEMQAKRNPTTLRQ